jgi:HEAT repeat protein
MKELFKYLADERSWVREEAARALGDIPTDRAARRLETVVVEDSERLYVRAAAADALGRIRNPLSFDVLTGLIATAGLASELKISLIHAICAYSNKEALQAITPLVGDGDIIVSAVAETQVRTKCGR